MSDTNKLLFAVAVVYAAVITYAFIRLETKLPASVKPPVTQSEVK
jgi:hypothetical protein